MCKSCVPTLVNFFEVLSMVKVYKSKSDDAQAFAVVCDCGKWMPFCIESIDSRSTVVDPCCFSCGDRIGSMPLDIYLSAMENKNCILSCQRCAKEVC